MVLILHFYLKNYEGVDYEYPYVIYNPFNINID